MSVVRVVLIVTFLLSIHKISNAQCPTASGDQVSYGVGSWIGYVYDGANSFGAGTYQGTITETEIFDESFCGDNCNFTAASGCLVNSETFSVRFKMQKTISTCGVYTFTIGGDDGVRLSIDGGSTYLINTLYNDHSYASTTGTAYLTPGTYNLVLDFYENGGQNRVTYGVSGPGVLGWGGVVAADQNLCQNPIDPAAFTNTSAAAFCNGISPTYLWQTSPDNAAWSDISGETNATYDVPSGLSVGTHYYRRRATNGTITVYSNTLTVVGDQTQGTESAYPPAGTGWIGYVYDGANNFSSSNYQGYITEGTTFFDESFCGDNCISAVNGCDIQTETFSVRFRLTLNVTTGAAYTFTIGADDGVRLSINGGSTYLVNDYSDHGYRTITSASTDLFPGTYLLVLDFYENGGGNRVTFSYTTGPLPVTWSYFDGYYQDGQNIVEWKTASERNNAGFEIQRSLDGVTFDSIGYTPGNGTTSLPSDYVFRDTRPAYGWNYYRLKQIDLDGTVDYSRLIPVQVSTLPESMIYPNPASKEIFIAHLAGSEPISVSLKSSATGRAYSLTQDTQQPARFLLDGIQPGIYVATFKIGKKNYTQKVVVY